MGLFPGNAQGGVPSLAQDWDAGQFQMKVIQLAAGFSCTYPSPGTIDFIQTKCLILKCLLLTVDRDRHCNLGVIQGRLTSGGSNQGLAPTFSIVYFWMIIFF